MKGWLFASLLLALGSCRSSEAGPYSPPPASSRSTAAAERLCKQAAEAHSSDPERAEELLRAYGSGPAMS